MERKIKNKSMHINLWEWLLFKTYMVYSTFLRSYFHLVFFVFLMEKHTRGEGQGMKCDENYYINTEVSTRNRDRSHVCFLSLLESSTIQIETQSSFKELQRGNVTLNAIPSTQVISSTF